MRVHVVDWREDLPDPDPDASLDPNEVNVVPLPRDNDGDPNVLDAEIDGDTLKVWTE